MNRFLDNVSLRFKLFLAPIACLVLLVLSTGGALWGFTQQRSALDSLYHERLPSYTFVAYFEAGLRDMNGLINRSLGYEAMGYNASEIAPIDNALNSTSGELKSALAERIRLGSAEEQALLSPLVPMFEAYSSSVTGALDMKVAGPAIASTFLSTAQAEYDKLLAATSKVSAVQLESAGRDVANASRSAQSASMTMGLLAVLALAAGIAMTLLIASGLVRRVSLLVLATGRLAEGDLAQEVQSQGRDEVGRLMDSMDMVRRRLAESMRAVQEASESVRVAAHEIASGNADLSSRTEQQAGSLQQTASSMEEMNSAVRNNADTARQANRLATEASQVASQGGDVVQQVVSTMDEITRSSRRIAEIIGTIDGIAFQTNILALNAAVEAARAGEQGRGFAVVAGEVRSLAQRSAEAAKQIKGLINDSVQKVEAGSNLVGHAGTTMHEIVSRVRGVSDLIGAITAATEEQSQGIDQVGQAVNQLDNTTQQNAALVEQSAAAAESLKRQANRLAEAVSFFRLKAN